MRRWIPFLLLLFLLAGCAASNEQENSYRQIIMDQSETMIEEVRNYNHLDVRTPEEFRDRHIPYANNIPN
ncbi:MAG: rhodanese-like domain-containing protein, partial [Candidatus Choladocola sp.]|nr:rhodanese-like domain-containing protein [Candidatus Choladocola sp.]